MEFCRELYTVAVFGHSRRKLAHVPRALVTRNRVSKMAEMRSWTRALLSSRNTCYARRLDTRSWRFSLYDPCSIGLFPSRKCRRFVASMVRALNLRQENQRNPRISQTSLSYLIHSPSFNLIFLFRFQNWHATFVLFGINNAIHHAW